MNIKYSVKNLRRLKKTSLIEIKPLTILVGRNSAGKSTFLRSLPLMRQSIETRSSAPILWYGQYVDFSNFETAVSYVGKDSGIKKEEEITFELSVPTFKYSLPFSDFENRRRIAEINNPKVSYSVGGDSEKTHLNRINLSVKFNGGKIKFDVLFSDDKSSEVKIKINDEDINELIKDYRVVTDDTNLFTHISFLQKKEIDADELDRRAMRRYHRYGDAEYIILDIFKETLKDYVPKSLKKSTIEYQIFKIIYSSDLSASRLKKLLDEAKNKTFEKIYANLISKPNDVLSKKIKLVYNLSHCIRILEGLAYRFNRYFQSVTYIGPARAAGERFYRTQELEVSEIYHDGRNFPIFLASLSKTNLNKFSDWVKGIFNYEISLDKKDGRISIIVKSDNQRINVTDTGYGISQILPVLGMIWQSAFQSGEKSIRRPRYFRSNYRTLAIEQPELHLHPAHQASLADVFVGAMTNNDIRFMVETHSETLINRLGELIAKKKISKDDVQVVIFSPENSDNISSPTTVSCANFDKDGVLENWPHGFFNYKKK